MFGKEKRLERELGEQGGVVAWATVLEARSRWTSGSNYDNGPYTVGNRQHMTVRLRVEPEGEAPFETKFRQTFAGRIPIPGFQAKVTYDPRKPSRIAILEGQIFPSGLSHERTERSAERGRRLHEAIDAGRTPEFIQEEIRDASRRRGG